MPQSTTSTILFLLSASFQIIGTLIADFFSPSHIYNDAWPAHAKFHTGQTISMAIILALLGMYFVFRPSQSSKQVQAKPEKADDITTATMVLNVYWLTQFLAFFFPGTHWCDDPFCHDVPFAPQLGIEVLGMGLNCTAWFLEHRALASRNTSKKSS